jgi:hypothetical protein
MVPLLRTVLACELVAAEHLKELERFAVLTVG